MCVFVLVNKIYYLQNIHDIIAYQASHGVKIAHSTRVSTRHPSTFVASAIVGFP